MKYAIFEPATGRIDRIIFCPVGSVNRSLQPGEDFMHVAGVEDDSTHYVHAFQLVQFPLRPSDAHAWDWASRAWVPTAA